MLLYGLRIRRTQEKSVTEMQLFRWSGRPGSRGWTFTEGHVRKFAPRRRVLRNCSGVPWGNCEGGGLFGVRRSICRFQSMDRVLELSRFACRVPPRRVSPLEPPPVAIAPQSSSPSKSVIGSQGWKPKPSPTTTSASDQVALSKCPNCRQSRLAHSERSAAALDVPPSIRAIRLRAVR
jgi:hypothetical protein